jgi:release factor glutamine methyltransferase
MNNGTGLQKLFRTSTIELKKAHIPSPTLDARVIFEFVLNISTEDFYKNAFIISPSQKFRIEKLVLRRTQHEPIAYLTGRKEFFGLGFLVNKNVLIPRPESERLIDKALEFLNNKKGLNVLDLGTGSGALIISVAKNNTNHNFFASDISAKALTVAKINIKDNNVKVNLYKSDLFNNIPQQKFDLIIANLPYVPKNRSKNQEVGSKDDIEYEPTDAIFTHDNGTEIIKRFLKQAKNYLNIDGAILIELDPRNAREIKSCAGKNFPNATLSLEKDLAGFDRYLLVEMFV